MAEEETKKRLDHLDDEALADIVMKDDKGLLKEPEKRLNRLFLGAMHDKLKEPERSLALGKIYAEGGLFPQDYVEGYKWFILAAEQGNKDAIEARDLLEKKMDSLQITEAQKLAEEIRSKGTMKVKTCSKCNRLKPQSAFCKIVAKKDGLHSVCKECDKKRAAQYYKTDKGHANIKEWMKQKDAEGYYRYGQGAIAKLRYGAKKRGISFSLTRELLEEWWRSTPDICCYCNVPIEEYIKIRDFIQNYSGANNNILKFKKFLRRVSDAHSRWMTIDRKDNQKGYEIDNITKACWFCNSLKNDFFSEEEFNKIAPQIISNLKKDISKENDRSLD